MAMTYADCAAVDRSHRRPTIGKLSDSAISRCRAVRSNGDVHLCTAVLRSCLSGAAFGIWMPRARLSFMFFVVALARAGHTEVVAGRPTVSITAADESGN